MLAYLVPQRLRAAVLVGGALTLLLAGTMLVAGKAYGAMQ